jgi:hypothetical protein
MMPWKLMGRNSKFPTLNPTIKKFGSTGRVHLKAIDLIDFDLGEDNYTRFNAYITTITSVGMQTSQQMIGDTDPKTGFPRILQNGIKRHGLRLFQRELNSMVDLGSDRADTHILKEFNEFSVELWARSHDYESGTLSIIGNNGIKLGKCVDLSRDVPYIANKLFYIEGYEDSFTVEENGSTMWTQTVFVTRGIEKDVLGSFRNLNKITKRVNASKSDGEFTGE